MKTKRWFGMLVTVLSFVLLASCGFGSGPGKTASDFMYELDRGNVSSAAKYFSADSRARFSSKITPAMTRMSQQIAARGGIKNITVVRENINGELADVILEISFHDGFGGREMFSMIKEEGEWKIIAR
ncbi:DUF4878 domain-containing protein [Candidatus Viridilinea mediisalina]|nr:DUF4878 domain-containing protein [Candidatus Viridilinea mediisalina]